MFKIAQRAASDVEPTDYIEGADGLAFGSAATITAGVLAKAAGKPTHIILGAKDSTGRYPAMRILPSTIFETEATATIGKPLVGSAVTLSPDALGVTATTASGVFTITKVKENGTVQGYFG